MLSSFFRAGTYQARDGRENGDGLEEIKKGRGRENLKIKSNIGMWAVFFKSMFVCLCISYASFPARGVVAKEKEDHGGGVFVELHRWLSCLPGVCCHGKLLFVASSPRHSCVCACARRALRSNSIPCMINTRHLDVCWTWGRDLIEAEQ